MARKFAPLPHVPDHPALEREVLARWDAERTFERLRELNEGRPKFSFIDGPITANNPMGVHHAWGRTLKDVFQRYQAARGHELALPERLRLPGPLGRGRGREVARAELQARHRGVRPCRVRRPLPRARRRVRRGDHRAVQAARDVDGLGQRLLHLQRHQHRVHLAVPQGGAPPRLAVHGPPLDAVVPALRHVALAARAGRRGELRGARPPVALRPLPAARARRRVARRLDDDPVDAARECRRCGQAGRATTGSRTASGGLRRKAATTTESCTARSSSGSSTTARSTSCRAQDPSAHRVIPWDEVELGEGTGIVHIAPGAGTEDFELGRVHGLPVIAPIDEGGRFYPGFGPFEGMSTAEVEEPIIAALRDKGLLVDAGRITHRYPICWRCRTPLLFRVVDDWFIGVDEIRERLLAENDDGRVDAAAIQEAHGRLAAQHGRLEHLAQALLRPPAALLSVRVRNAERGRLARASSRSAPCAGSSSCRSSTGPGSTRCRSAASRATRRCSASPRSATPGSTRASSRSRRSAGRTPTSVPHGYATGAAQGLTGADLPDHAYWQKWFPADWISEMREQIRLWFYSQFFMSVTMVGRSPYRRVLTYEKLLDETGARCTARGATRSTRTRRSSEMGADVMRWLFCADPAGPEPEVRLRARARGQAPPAHALELGLVLRHLRQHRGVHRRPTTTSRAGRPTRQPLDALARPRTRQLVAETTEAYERYWTPAVTRAFESFVDDLSNWYIRRSRRRF